MPELPSGTVTFLFTDVEGSTRLLKSVGRELYGRLLSEHQQILRDVFAATGGREIDTQGDAFFVAFARVSDAVEAAVTAQKRLASHRWPAGQNVRLRIGVHTGEPSVGGDRYIGLGVHRAARISAAGHGGQVLLSQASAGVLEDDDLPADVTLRDLGEYALKDIDRPERLFQLVIEGLPNEFDPPRIATRGRAPGAPFAGREEELAETAKEVLARPRVRRRRLLLALALAGAGAGVAVALVYALARDESGAKGSPTAGPPVSVAHDSVAVIDPDSNIVVAGIPVGDQPGAIAVGEGSVWVANDVEQTLVRIDAKTRRVTRRIGLGIEATDVAVGEGAVWVAGGFDGALLRIDPKTNLIRARLQIRERIGPLPPGQESGPSALAIGDGAVWLAHGNEVSRIDPATNRVVATIRAGGPWSGAITVGEGALWVAESDLPLRRETDPRTGVSKVDPDSKSVVATLPVAGLVPAGTPPRPAADALAAGHGAVWAASWAGGLLWRIDPRTGFVERTIPVPEPTNVAIGGSRDVWITNTDGHVTRVDAITNAVVTTIDVCRRRREGQDACSYVTSAAHGEGALWVVAQ